RLPQASQSSHGLVLRGGIKRGVQELARSLAQRMQHEFRLIPSDQTHRMDWLPEISDKPDNLASRFGIRSNVHQHDVGSHLAETDFERLWRWIGLQFRDDL